MSRAVAAIAEHQELIGDSGATKQQAETMANASQELWSALRAMDSDELDQWLITTPDADRSRILEALAAVRRAMQP